MKQYWSIKNQYKEFLLFFRLGDFYELFDNDAVIASEALDIVLTKRAQKDMTVAMCGVPHHAAEIYIQRLLNKGHKIAICEQTEEASPGKTLINREVVRVLTPGTLTQENLLPAREPNYLCVVSKTPDMSCFFDITTGNLFVEKADLIKTLSSYNPKEILMPKSIFDKHNTELYAFRKNMSLSLTVNSM